MMPVSTYNDGLDPSTLLTFPKPRHGGPLGARPRAAHRMMLRVIDDYYMGPRASDEVPGLRLFDRLRFFTTRLAQYGLQTAPVLGNGCRLNQLMTCAG